MIIRKLYCTKCGQEVKYTDVTCPYCMSDLSKKGGRIELPVEDPRKFYCKKCGQEVKYIDVTCPHCGSDLSRTGRLIEFPVQEKISLRDKQTNRLVAVSIGAGLLGAVFGGLPGAIIGAALGIFLGDRKNKEERKRTANR